tara:strand:- start:346 stop:546 length:201 start_codon:yes stop_codon:yes gene_type:complete
LVYVCFPAKTDEHTKLDYFFLKKYQYKSGESGNSNGRPKDSLNRKTIAREYLAFLQKEANPLTGIK